jgi:hypothetical protein
MSKIADLCRAMRKDRKLGKPAVYGTVISSNLRQGVAWVETSDECSRRLRLGWHILCHSLVLHKGMRVRVALHESGEACAVLLSDEEGMTGSFTIDAVLVKPLGEGAKKVETPGNALWRHRETPSLEHRPGGWMRDP